MKAKLALICGAYPPLKCGIGDFVHRLASELAKRGRTITVVTDGRAKEDNIAGVQVLPIVRGWRPGMIPGLLSTLRQMDVSVVNLHYPALQYGRISGIDWLPGLMRSRLRLPVVTTLHEYSSFGPLGRLRVRRLARASSAVIVPDPAEQAVLARQASLPPERVRHIPLAPSLEPAPPDGFDRQQLRAQQGAGEKDCVLVFFGFIGPGKGVETLIEALEHVPSERRCHLWLLADRVPRTSHDAAYHRQVEARVSRLRVPVAWTGYLEAPQVSAFLGSGDLAVLPFDDGASMRRTSLLVSIAHGLPVLSTGVAPPCEGVEVVPARDPHALARAIDRLAAHREERNALAAAGRETASRLCWPEVASQTASVLDEFA